MSSDLESASCRASAVSGEGGPEGRITACETVNGWNQYRFEQIDMAEMIRCGISPTPGSLYCFEVFFGTLEFHVAM